MSLVATGIALGKTQILQKGLSLFGGLFGGDEGPNIARSLSKQVGFTVLQSDAPAVRARLAAGLDPRTGVRPAPGVVTKTTGGTSIGQLFNRVLKTAVGTAVSVPAALSQQEVERIINRPAVGSAPPIALPPPVPLPTVAKEVLQSIAKPRSIPARKMVPPSPPGGGKVSLLPAAGMAGIGAIARMGGRGLIRTTTGKISKIMLPSGQVFSRKNAASLIRRVGFEAAAVALGITVVEAAELLLADSQTRRRGRGITAAQVRNARRTTRMVCNLARDLGVKAAPVRRRKTTCR